MSVVRYHLAPCTMCQSKAKEILIVIWYICVLHFLTLIERVYVSDCLGGNPIRLCVHISIPSYEAGGRSEGRFTERGDVARGEPAIHLEFGTLNMYFVIRES